MGSAGLRAPAWPGRRLLAPNSPQQARRDVQRESAGGSERHRESSARHCAVREPRAAGAAWIQLRAALGYNAQQALVRAYARLARRPPVALEARAALPPVERDVASRHEALAVLCAALA